MDYNKTINLPKTDFPMRAGLPKREPEMLKRWQDMDLYNELLKKNEVDFVLGLSQEELALRSPTAACTWAMP